MSMESAVAFYERLEKDVELQEKLKELGTKENISQYVKGELGCSGLISLSGVDSFSMTAETAFHSCP